MIPQLDESNDFNSISSINSLNTFFMSEYYRHYKGNYYQKIGVARHSETLEEMVVYQALYGNHDMWVRPRAMFEEMVSLADGQTVPRFAPVSQQEYESSLETAARASDSALLDTLVEHFRHKGYTAEDFYGGCSLCGDANEFALDEIEAYLKKEMPQLSKFDRDRLTSQLYNQIHSRLDQD